jgi:hypothetical protein
VIPRSSAARAAWIASALTLPVYWATMNRTVGFIDRGELAAAAATFGIPHPTGYPTLMLVAGAVTHLLPLRPVLALNALVGLFAAAGAAALTLLLDRVLLAAAGDSIGPRARAAYALLAALFVALTMTWWQQANGFEVYALHALFMPLVVLLSLRWIDAAAESAPGQTSTREHRAGFAFALVTGLSFTNHLTTLLLAPGLLIAAGMRLGWGRRLWRGVARLAPAFVIGLLPYAWLPLRSAMHPRFDWGGVRSLGAFLHHVSGVDYQRWMFAHLSTMTLQARYLLWRIPLDYAVVGVLVAGLGAGLLARRVPRLAALSLGLAVAGAAFAAGYGIPDLDGYLLTIVLGLALCFAAGLLRLHERFGPRVAIPLAAALVVLNGALHWRACDEHGNRMVEGFVHDVLGPLPRNAVLFTDLWENLDAASYYFQEVEGLRRDVVIVSPVLARKGWYLDELERRSPGLIARAGGAYREYREALRSAERGGPASLERLESARHDFLDALAAGCMRDRAVFSTGALKDLRPGWRPVPWHLAVWIRPDTAYVPEPPAPLAFRPWTGNIDVYAAQTYQTYAQSRLARARYEARSGRPDDFARLTREARAFDPHIRPECVGPLPLGFDRYVLMSAQFFRELSATDPVTALR